MANHWPIMYVDSKTLEFNFGSFLWLISPHAFWNISDFGAQCEKCETINTVTIEMGELKKLV
jgi:hypothetical protein